MDKQLMEEFYKGYFGKNQLKRRIYDEEELENIWREINIKRKGTAINVDLKISDEKCNWYNLTDDVKLMISYINDIEKSEIINYLKDKSDKSISRFREYCEVLDVDNIEKFYIDEYTDKNIVDRNIYRELNSKLSLDESKYCTDEKNKYAKDLLKNIFDFVQRDKSCHTIIKAAILNFYISYLSPFINYNIEMADYITNKYLISNRYEIMRYSQGLKLIKSDERRYYMAIENSIVNNGDITYFIKYYVGVIQGAIKELTKEVGSKHGKKIIKELIEKNNVSLDDRQIKYVNSMVVLNSNKINIDDYKKKSRVSYETARSDLNMLVALGFFRISKLGKKYEYYFNDIATIIDNFNDINTSF